MSVNPQQYSPKQQMIQPDFELQYKRDSYLMNVELHHHDFYELYYLVSGDVTYTIESKLYKILPGDVLLISPSELHQVHIEAEHAAYERYVLWIKPQYLHQLSTDSTDLSQALDPAKPGYGNQLRLHVSDQQKLRGLMEQLYVESRKAGFGADILSKSLLIQLLVMVNRLALREDCRPEAVYHTSRAVSQVVEFINLHYSEQLSLDMLAETFYISKYHLSHEFQRQVGTSVGRYILKKRLQIARRLLSQGSKLYPADSVIISISQGPANAIVNTTTGLDANERGLLIADDCGKTSRPGIFASGDVVQGSRTVVEAVAYSKRVAEAMHQYIQSSL